MKKRAIFLVGGGSGGHITPLLVIAEQLKKDDPSTQVVFVTERGGKFVRIITNNIKNPRVKKIWAGKFRRYYGVSLWRQLIDIKTTALNLRDIVLFMIGFFESLMIIMLNRPKAVFVKGGFVSLPFGLAARLLRVPYVTHDSDTKPSLTNKIIGGGARFNLLAFSDNCKSYDHVKTRKTGVPIASSFKPYTQSEKTRFRQDLGVPQDAVVLLIVGGSIGADRLNRAVADIVPELLEKNKKLYIIHQIGEGQTDYYKHKNNRLKLIQFIDNMSHFGAASDIVVSRAGATAISEFATLGRALIVVPSPYLTGGHQLENAELLKKNQAGLVINESPALASDILAQIQNLIDDSSLRKKLEKNIGIFSSEGTAKAVVEILKTIGS
ncbi:hypothetical protein A3F37_02905 [Candidatus Saccharibacteria bacterium RIFCSPHIGHO2_12_FULL_41_12]|nr:MAG: hypothetical protein A3F37_02905 [Candidatus Saccharibacteria bacterium RIFCSPHIGHO2_12_FULL_41_12]